MSLTKRILGFLLLGLIATPALLQDQSPWALTSAQPFQDIVGEEYDVRYPALSPEGSAVAWFDGGKDQVCAFFFEGEQATCYDTPDNLRLGRFSYPSWSADGRSLAFSESFFDLLTDSDIWVLDVDSGVITNITDDQVYGGLLRLEDAPPVDYLPTWNPANGELYFFRSTRVEGGWTTALYHVADLAQEPEELVDLSFTLPILSIYQKPSISPDGTRMVLNVMGPEQDDERNGVYVLALADGSFTQVADLADLQTGFPDWAIENVPLVAENLTWVGDEALVVSAGNRQGFEPLADNTIYIDLANNTVTPLVDLSDVAEKSDFLTIPGPANEIARIGVVSPANDTFLTLRYGPNFEAVTAAALSLPPSGEEATVIGEIPEFLPRPGTLNETGVSTDGKVLLFGWLLTFEQE